MRNKSRETSVECREMRDECRVSSVESSLERRTRPGEVVHSHSPLSTLHSPLPRNGFTLVEMLVSVALVLIMMLMFTQIFQIATGSIVKQRGLAENDQRGRTLSVLLKADFDKRTFRDLKPIIPDEQATYDGLIDETKRQGYFYISENDPANDVDDVLKFTIRSTQAGSKNRDDSPYYGNAVSITFPSTADGWIADQAYIVGDWTISSDDALAEATFNTPPGMVYRVASVDPAPIPGDSPTSGLSDPFPSTPTPWQGYTDGQITWIGYLPNPDNKNQPIWDDGSPGVTASLSREAEVIYFVRHGALRRRVLLLRQPLNSPDPLDPQPKNGYGDDYFFLGGGFGSKSPAYIPKSGSSFWNEFDFSAHYTGSGPKFHGSSWLSNDDSGGLVSSLGDPKHRFGHNHADGKPREFITSNTTTLTANTISFIGSFTLQETAHSSFQYPFKIGPSPMSKNTALSLSNGVVSAYGNQSNRRAEDILMTNVHGFDIKVWDDAIGDFVDIGHNITDTSSNPIGYYNINNTITHQNVTYGPSLDTTLLSHRVYDTWHPAVDLDPAGGTQTYTNTKVEPDTNNDPPPYRPQWYAPNLWAAGTAYSVGNRVKPNPNSTAAGTDWDGTFVYRVKSIVGDGKTHATDEPDWGAAISPGITIIDNNVVWEAVDNRVALRAIKITVRYYDTASDQMRQLTLVQSLVD